MVKQGSVKIRKETPKPAPNHPKSKKSLCTVRDVVIGFFAGAGIAASSVNSKRQPVIDRSVTKSVPVSSTKNTASTIRSSSPATYSPEAKLPLEVPFSSPADRTPFPLPTLLPTEERITAESSTAATVSDVKISTHVAAASTDIPAVFSSAVVNRTVTEDADIIWSTTPNAGQRNFFEIADRMGTDKVWGTAKYALGCQHDPSKCYHPDMTNRKCGMMPGHFYDQIYNRWLGKYSMDDVKPFQFLEIGFYNGKGFDSYQEFLPRAEMHSIEIACIEPGPRSEGKWPWGNFPSGNPRYQEYLDDNKLHCGDGSDFEYLQETWTTKMKRPGAPPLKVVVEDASHLSDHMAKSLFFWFPKIEPGGIMVVEDVQPIPEANNFRLHVVPQVLKDLHYCGSPTFQDKACFPTIWPLLQSVHCEMHICVFERNNEPAVEYTTKDLSFPPPHALHSEECLLRAHN